MPRLKVPNSQQPRLSFTTKVKIRSKAKDKDKERQQRKRTQSKMMRSKDKDKAKDDAKDKVIRVKDAERSRSTKVQDMEAQVLLKPQTKAHQSKPITSSSSSSP